MDTCVIWIHHYYVRRDETCFLKLQLARVCFFYTHISFHRNWSDFSQALSKARDTKQINVSEVIIYQKTLSANAATMYWSIFWRSIVISWDILFRSKAQLFQLSILYHVYLNVYLPAVNRHSRDIFGWIFGSFFSKTSAAWKSDKGNAHSDWISHHCGCLRRREYNRVVFCWLTSSHLVLHKAVNAIFFGVSRLYI